MRQASGCFAMLVYPPCPCHMLLSHIDDNDACPIAAHQVHYVGVGHSGEVTGLAVAPDTSAVVSVGSEGGIFIWEYPCSEGEGLNQQLQHLSVQE